MMCLLLLLCCFQDHPATQFAAGRQEARQLYRAGNFAGFLETTERLHHAQPGHVPTLQNLAMAYALVGQNDAALATLSKAADLGIMLELPDQPEFKGARETPAYAQHLERLSTLAGLKGQASVAFRLEQPDFFPEGLAYDAGSGAFFMGSVHLRKIMRRDAQGQLSEWVSTGRDELKSVLGLVCDSERRRLWATSNGIPQTRGIADAELDSAAIYGYDLDSGALVTRVTLPGKHNLGDLTLAANGDLLASDAMGSGIYRLALGASELELLASSPFLASAQGMAFSADGALLYVADYTYGLLLLDLQTHEVTQLPSDVQLAITGIDGLVRHGQSLIGIQNGVRPNRVMRWTLSADGRRITASEVLLANSPEFDEPTLGIVVDDSYYLVANGQWGRYDRRFQPLPADKLNPPCVLRLSL